MLEFFQILSKRFQQVTQGFRTKPVECLRLLLENPVGHILKLRIQLLPQFLHFFLLILQPFFQVATLCL